MSNTRLVLLAVLFVSTTAAAVAQPPADDQAKVFAAWEQRQKAIPVAWYKVKWETLPAKEVPLGGTAEVRLDFPQNRVRVDFDEFLRLSNIKPPRSRTRFTIRFDGRQQMASYHLNLDAAAAPAEPTDVEVAVTGWGRHIQWPRELDPILWAHGAFRSMTDREDRGDPPTKWRPDPNRFIVIGRENIDGRECVVLDDKRVGKDSTSRLSVDLDRGGAAVRRLRGHDGGWKEDIAVEYRETPRGWVVAGWSVTETAKAGAEPVVRNRTQVEVVSLDDAGTEADFRIAYKPGMEVGIAVADNDDRMRGYRVAADGQLVRIPPPPTKPTTFLGGVTAMVKQDFKWALGGLLLVAVLTTTLVRRRMSRRAAPAR